MGILNDKMKQRVWFIFRLFISIGSFPNVNTWDYFQICLNVGKSTWQWFWIFVQRSSKSYSSVGLRRPRTFYCGTNRYVDILAANVAGHSHIFYFTQFVMYLLVLSSILLIYFLMRCRFLEEKSRRQSGFSSSASEIFGRWIQTSG